MDEAVIKRIPPHSVEAERAVIGSMIMDRDAILTSSEILTAEEFYQGQYGELFQALVDLYRSGVAIDLVTLQNKLREMETSPELSSPEYLANLTVSVPTSANVKNYADIVHEKAVLRRLIQVSEKVTANCYMANQPLTVAAYLMICQKQFEDRQYEGYYNVGPDESDCVTTERLVDTFCKLWGENQSWINQYDGGPHEANFLKLDCSKLKKVFGWKPCWDFDMAMEKTVEWSKVYEAGGDMAGCIDSQIREFFAENILMNAINYRKYS